MSESIGPCVNHAISRSRDILGYGLFLDDVREFALQIMEHGGWPTSHPRASVVPVGSARAGDLLLLSSPSGSGHLAVMLAGGLVEDLRGTGVCVLPFTRVRRLIRQVWRPTP